LLKAAAFRVSDACADDAKDRQEKALPFKPLVPNEETIESEEAARHLELTAVMTGGASLRIASPLSTRPSLRGTSDPFLDAFWINLFSLLATRDRFNDRSARAL